MAGAGPCLAWRRRRLAPGAWPKAPHELWNVSYHLCGGLGQWATHNSVQRKGDGEVME